MELWDEICFSLDEDVVLVYASLFAEKRDDGRQFVDIYEQFKRIYPNFKKDTSLPRGYNFFQRRASYLYKNDLYFKAVLSVMNARLDYLEENVPLDAEPTELSEELVQFYLALQDEPLQPEEMQKALNGQINEFAQQLQNLKWLQYEFLSKEINDLFEKQTKPFLDEFNILKAKTLDLLSEQMSHLRNQCYIFFEHQNEQINARKQKIENFMTGDLHLLEELQKLKQIYQYLFKPEYLCALLLCGKALKAEQLVAACHAAIGRAISEPFVVNCFLLKDCQLITENDFQQIMRNCTDQDVFKLLNKLKPKEYLTLSMHDLHEDMLNDQLDAIPAKFVYQEAIIRESEVLQKLMQLDYENLQLKKRDEMLSNLVDKISPKNQLIFTGTYEIHPQLDVTGLKAKFFKGSQIQKCCSKEFYTLNQLFPVDLFILQNKGGQVAVGIENRQGDKLIIQSDGLCKNNVSQMCTDLGQQIEENDILSFVINKNKMGVQIFKNGRLLGQTTIGSEYCEFKIVLEVFCYGELVEVRVQFGQESERVQGREWVE